MAQEVSENTKLTLDLKTLGMVVGFTVSLATMYFTLKSEIALAMDEPKPAVTSVEFEYKDKLVRSTIEKIDTDLSSVKGDVEEIEEQLNKIDERLYEISQR